MNFGSKYTWDTAIYPLERIERLLQFHGEQNPKKETEMWRALIVSSTPQIIE